MGDGLVVWLQATVSEKNEKSGLKVSSSLLRAIWLILERDRDPEQPSIHLLIDVKHRGIDQSYTLGSVDEVGDVSSRLPGSVLGLRFVVEPANVTKEDTGLISLSFLDRKCYVLISSQIEGDKRSAIDAIVSGSIYRHPPVAFPIVLLVGLILTLLLSIIPACIIIAVLYGILCALKVTNPATVSLIIGIISCLILVGWAGFKVGKYKPLKPDYLVEIGDGRSRFRIYEVIEDRLGITAVASLAISLLGAGATWLPRTVWHWATGG